MPLKSNSERLPDAYGTGNNVTVSPVSSDYQSEAQSPVRSGGAHLRSEVERESRMGGGTEETFGPLWKGWLCVFRNSFERQRWMLNGMDLQFGRSIINGSIWTLACRLHRDYEVRILSIINRGAVTIIQKLARAKISNTLKRLLCRNTLVCNPFHINNYIVVVNGRKCKFWPTLCVVVTGVMNNIEQELVGRLHAGASVRIHLPFWILLLVVFLPISGK